jgi:hypothetical protein
MHAPLPPLPASAGEQPGLAPGRGPARERFQVQDGLVQDLRTGLAWPRDAATLPFPLPWAEALDAVAGLGAQGLLGRRDWRLPNRRELRSLVDHAMARPCLPLGHPFESVFQGWCWTSTSAALAPAYAWRVHLAGGRMFYGRKDEPGLAWPVCGAGPSLAATGQAACYDVAGREIPCPGSGQDGELRVGVPWPAPRFAEQGSEVRDRLTGLAWSRDADPLGRPMDWPAAQAALRGLGDGGWRMPDINELESLVDAATHSPALPAGHPFVNVREAYWSSTPSGYAPGWAFCLYLHKGAVGVGHAPGPEFSAWPVRGTLPPAA